MPKVKVKKTGVELKILQSQLNNINRETWQEVGEWWHSRFTNKRFTRRGANELGYTPRKFVTNLIKKKLFGHTDPNVFTGESKRVARVKNVRAFATKKKARARIRYNTPRLNFKNPKSQVHPANEIRRVSDNETRQTNDRLVRVKEKKIEQFAKGR